MQPLGGLASPSHCPSEACEPQRLEVDMCLRVQTSLMTPATETEWAHQTTGKTRRKTYTKSAANVAWLPSSAFGVPQGPRAGCALN